MLNMKQLKEFINESFNDFDIEEVATGILDIASERLANKLKSSSPDDIIDTASEGEYTDYDKVAELLQCDPDELYDFIDNNYNKISKFINKEKKNY